MSNLINYLQHTDALINAADEDKPSNLIPFHTFQKLQSPTEGGAWRSCVLNLLQLTEQIRKEEPWRGSNRRG